MEIKKFFSKGENLFGMGFLLLLAVYVVLLMVGDVSRMQEATTKYDYYQNFIYLIDNIARTYFCCIFLLMVYLTYINKQYSKWCIICWAFQRYCISPGLASSVGACLIT